MNFVKFVFYSFFVRKFLGRYWAALIFFFLIFNSEGFLSTASKSRHYVFLVDSFLFNLTKSGSVIIYSSYSAAGFPEFFIIF